MQFERRCPVHKIALLEDPLYSAATTEGDLSLRCPKQLLGKCEVSEDFFDIYMISAQQDLSIAKVRGINVHWSQLFLESCNKIAGRDRFGRTPGYERFKWQLGVSNRN